MDTGIRWAVSLNDAIQDTDLIVIITEWEEFKQLNFTKVRQALRTSRLSVPTVVDLRNLYEPKALMTQGIRYISVGRPMGEPMLKLSTMTEKEAN